jgi:DNA-binding FadR family transcriptional regulator
MPNADKKAAEVARRIEAEIVARGWPLGELLGSEPELIARYGVSRAVFREAVRIVEHDGAARMRRGPGGGLVVTAPDLAAVEEAATLFLDHADVSAQDLFDVRSSLELTCVSILAENLTEAGAARLRQVLEHEKDLGGDGVENRRAHDLHIVIADLTGNPAMRLFVETLTRLTSARVGHLQFDVEDLREVHAAHEAIVEAIVSGNATLAAQRMRRHLAEAVTFYYRRQEVQAGEPIRSLVQTRESLSSSPRQDPT